MPLVDGSASAECPAFTGGGDLYPRPPAIVSRVCRARAEKPPVACIQKCDVVFISDRGWKGEVAPGLAAVSRHKGAVVGTSFVVNQRHHPAVRHQSNRSVVVELPGRSSACPAAVSHHLDLLPAHTGVSRHEYGGHDLIEGSKPTLTVAAKRRGTRDVLGQQDGLGRHGGRQHGPRGATVGSPVQPQWARETNLRP